VKVMGNNAYVIDTSSLLELRPFLKYKKTIVSLWSNMENIIDAGRLMAPDMVFDDLKVKSDDILFWAKSHRSLFKKVTSSQLKILKDIENKYPQWVDPNSNKNQADPYVVALAIAMKQVRQKGLVYSNVIVVNEESKDPKRLKIPSVCKGYGVESINLSELFEKEGWQF
jgi:hypothetical protein